MIIKQILFGRASYIPGVYRIFTHTGGTNSARYCYSIWLRHLVLAQKHGLIKQVPRVVAELGPGDSLGIGLAALLSGVEVYLAFDLVRFASSARNLAVFDELVKLYQTRSDIPDETEFPHVGLKLDSYRFPSDLVLDNILQEALDEERIKDIRLSLTGIKTEIKHIDYIVPWNDPGVLLSSCVDMVIAQAVMEHVDDIESAYRGIYLWLKPGGIFSQEIDFTDHGIANVWNGHWSYSKLTWRLMRGNRPFFLNRQPLSIHLELLAEIGFAIAFADRKIDPRGIERRVLAREFRGISDEDLTTYSCFIQSVKLIYPSDKPVLSTNEE